MNYAEGIIPEACKYIIEGREEVGEGEFERALLFCRQTIILVI